MRAMEGWPIYGEAEIRRIAAGGRYPKSDVCGLSALHSAGRQYLELDQRAEDFIRREGAIPAFKGYKPPFEDKAYPYTLCVSINHEVVHGFPASEKS
jgi:methionyl aminopeptidase